MRRSDLTLCLITDEVSPSLDEGLAFARAEGIGTIDLRVIDGRNVLALSRDELAERGAARAGRRALRVVHLHAALEVEPARQGVASQGRPVRLRARRPARRAWSTRKPSRPRRCLGARNLRIFSYLAYDGYRVDDLRGPIDDLLALAEKFDMKLHVENEGVCNIAGFAELEALVTAYRHPRLRALPDIANAYRSGSAAVGRRSGATAALHGHAALQGLHQYCGAALRRHRRGRYPVHGPAGGRPPRTRGAPDTDHQSHTPSEPAATTRHSVHGLRRMVDDLGLT